MVSRQQLRIIIFLAVTVIGTLVVRYVLTGGLATVRLKPAPPLAGVVAQSLGTSGSGTSLPVPGKDFNLKNVQYFDNRTWAVASASPINGNADTATVILRQTGAQYQVVLGPGTAFSADYLQSLPLDVGQYLTSHGVIYDNAD